MKIRMIQLTRRLPARMLAAALTLTSLTGAGAATYHVSPNGNDGNAGSQLAPWKSIAKANSALQPGDTVLIHAGTYTDQIRPARSGTSEAARIVYRVAGDGDVILTGFPNTGGPNEGALALGTRSYVTVSGAAPADAPGTRRLKLLPNVFVSSYGNVCGGSYNVIENVYMGSTTPSRSADRGFGFCINFWSGDYETKYNIFRNNHVIGSAAQSLPYTEDLLTLAHRAHHNLIEGNILENCKHATVYYDSSASHTNAFRNNRIINHYHTALSLWGAGSGNLIEGNYLEASGADASTPAGPGNALQFQSADNIVRYNVMTRGGATDNQYTSVGGVVVASGGSNSNYSVSAAGNRFYNNTYVKNNGIATGSFWWSYAADLGRSKFVNNIFYSNNVAQTLPRPGIQIYYEGTQSVPGGVRDLYVNNLIGNPQGTNPTPAASATIITTPRGNFTAASAQSTLVYPGDPEFRGILQVDPGFIDFSNGDYGLKSSSGLVDAGSHLTSVSSSDGGSGTVLRVDDARFFQDGRGIPGLQADWIAVGTPSNISQIQSIDYSTNTVVLATGIPRQAGAAVWLYRLSGGKQILSGVAPDVGAFELLEQTANTLPPPNNMRALLP
jgi:hypothetical protein